MIFKKHQIGCLFGMLIFTIISGGQQVGSYHMVYLYLNPFIVLR